MDERMVLHCVSNNYVWDLIDLHQNGGQWQDVLNAVFNFWMS